MSFITKKIRRNESCINNRPFPVVNRTQPVGTPSILVHGEKEVKDKTDLCHILVSDAFILDNIFSLKSIS